MPGDPENLRDFLLPTHTHTHTHTQCEGGRRVPSELACDLQELTLYRFYVSGTWADLFRINLFKIYK